MGWDGICSGVRSDVCAMMINTQNTHAALTGAGCLRLRGGANIYYIYILNNK